MNQISDEFLLSMASVSATLIGLFLIGIFFYVEKGLKAEQSFKAYLRVGTKITLIVFGISTCLPITLVALDIVWSRLLLAILSLMLLVANVQTLILVMRVTTKSPLFLLNELVTTVMAVLLVGLPWIAGGLHPTREHVTWAILLAFGAAFLSIGSTVLSVFDATPESRRRK